MAKKDQAPQAETHTRAFSVPLSFRHVDQLHARFEIDPDAALQHGLRSNRIVEFDTMGFPGDFDLQHYDVTGTITITYDVVEKKKK